MTSVAINNEWREVMKNLFNRFVREDQGQDLIEYALLAGFISLAATVGITLVGTDLLALYNAIAAKVVAATPAAS
jgi:pilus assembly protein Flp/PilA